MSNHEQIEDLSLAEIFSRYSLVIPEMQREYVWGTEAEKDVLDRFYKDLIANIEAYANRHNVVGDRAKLVRDDVLNVVTKAGLSISEDDLARFAESLNEDSATKGCVVSTNVGFLYAYIPGYVADGCVGRVLPALLIDGQQRMTSLFLVWLCLASKACRFEDFERKVLHGSDLAFDFKVRHLTRAFLRDLVDRVRKQSDKEEGFDFSNINDSMWFNAAYSRDISVMAMTRALKEWSLRFDESGLDPLKAYDYVSNRMHFWLFVMNDAHQGERLYITMNGRGKNLSESEIIRAKVFQDAGDEKSKDVGRLFESVTDFFWNRRIKGETNADRGEKKFLHWVYLLERFDNEWIVKKDENGGNENLAFSSALKNELVDGTKFKIKESFFERNLVNYERIKKSYDALKFLCDREELRQCLRDSVWRHGAEHNSFQMDCFALLPLLYLLSHQDRDTQSESFDTSDLERFARYIRNMASKESVGKRPRDAVPQAILFAKKFADFDGDLLTFISNEGGKDLSYLFETEEVLKAKGLLSIEDADLRRRFENLIRAIEDYKREDGDYRIGVILDMAFDWKNTSSWVKESYDKLAETYQLIRRFFRERPSSLRIPWLMRPSHGAYFLWNGNKVLPYNKSILLDNRELIKHIVELEKLADTNGVENAFLKDEVDFLKNNLKEVSDSKDAHLIAAVLAAMQRRRKGAWDASWTRVEYVSDYGASWNGQMASNFHKWGAKWYFWMAENTGNYKPSTALNNEHVFVAQREALTEEKINEIFKELDADEKLLSSHTQS